ncbi:MAG: hypothetical protein CMK03_00610 [Ponticaulis sp.]|nr:hypothetical protein [Ponticaulis sp.]
MRILKVERGQGYFLSEKPEQQYQPIDEITKDDLLRLLTIVVENEVEMDAPDKDQLTNQAHLIIYQSIQSKLDSMSQNKQKFRDESQRKFATELDKYGK